MESNNAVFEGCVEIIVLESEKHSLSTPSSGEEIKQKLFMRRNGQLTLTRYFSKSCSNEAISKGFNKKKRFSFKPNEKLMDYIAFYFSYPYTPDNNCCDDFFLIELTNTEGKKFLYRGILGKEISVCDINLSEIARKTLDLDELWMFDGGID